MSDAECARWAPTLPRTEESGDANDVEARLLETAGPEADDYPRMSPEGSVRHSSREQISIPNYNLDYDSSSGSSSTRDTSPSTRGLGDSIEPDEGEDEDDDAMTDDQIKERMLARKHRFEEDQERDKQLLRARMQHRRTEFDEKMARKRAKDDAELEAL